MKRQQRKTFDVADLLFKVNFFLKNSKPEQVGERKGNAALLETVLMATKNYKGFGYLEQKPLQPGQTVPELGDQSRVFYYVANALKDDYAAAERRYKEMWGEN
jgi:hypothetical protein